MADLFDVVSDPTRRELLHALLDELGEPDGPGEASVGKLVSKLGLSQPTVSKHLKTLREFQIVTVREQGQHRYYRLDPHALEPVAEWLAAFVKPAVAAGDPVADGVQEVAALASSTPLAPRARTAAVHIGTAAATVVSRLRR